MYGSVLLWMWASICFHILVLGTILYYLGSIWASFGTHLDVIGPPNGIPKRLGDQNGAGKLPGQKTVNFRIPCILISSFPFSWFSDNVLKLYDFLGMWFTGVISLRFAWIPGRLERWKSCKTIRGSFKIKVSHIQKKRGSMSRFGITLGSILEAFGSQSQILGPGRSHSERKAAPDSSKMVWKEQARLAKSVGGTCSIGFEEPDRNWDSHWPSDASRRLLCRWGLGGGVGTHSGYPYDNI